jgi:hypothetical protein
MYRDPPHYLKPLKTTRTPKRLAFLDVATQAERKGGNRELRWACGALGLTHWTAKAKVRKDSLKVFESALDLWKSLDTAIVAGKRTVLVTFDLPEQARTSQALLHLPKLGWHLETVVLEPGASWMLWRDGKRSLMFVDLKSWMPYDWERLASAVTHNQGVSITGKLGGDPVKEACFNRCQIIRAATLTLLDWVESTGLGPFKPTGAGQSYSAFRRKYLSHRILVHDDALRLTAERVSMWSGRVEAWRHGRISGGPFLELDMKAAYSRIAAECNVPTIAQHEVRNPSVDRILKRTGKYAYLCEVEVDTEIPVCPANAGAHTFWPVGQFTSWVWEPELSLLAKYASHVKIRRAYRYRTAPALADFATFVLSELDYPSADVPPIARLVLKHWSRSLVGRLALRYRSWIPFSDDNDPDLSMVTFIDVDEHSMTDMLCVGTDMLLLGDLTESVESVPQVPAWVMSECRRRLWETMIEIGLDRVVYVDTDSIIIDTYGSRTFERQLIERYRGRWAPKSRLFNLHIQGPRNLYADSDRRISGLPTTAVQSGPTEYQGQVMRSIKESMRHGQLGTVTSVPRSFMFTAPDIRRKHLPGGATEPFRVNKQTDKEGEW